MSLSFVRYIGGKHRIAPQIAARLKATGRSCLVDVFGGSGAVTMNAGFKKRVYNDADGDLVAMFRVVADPVLRQAFLQRCRWTIPSREMFGADHDIYKRGGLSFRNVADPVDRALKTYYRLSFCFGGKMRSGGFQVSPCDREPIKEVARWSNMLRRIAGIGEFWRNTVVENLHYQDCIRIYGAYKDTVLFADPPYFGTERYYSVNFTAADHTFLAEQLTSTPAPVVLTYYDTPELQELYPSSLWRHESISAVTNGNNRLGARSPKKKVQEIILTKKGGINVTE